VSRKLIVLTLVSWAIALLNVAPSPAQEDEETPLAKIMKKVDARTKAIREATSTVAKYKKAGKGKDIIPTARELLKLGKEIRPFKEPSQKMKKPYEKWTDLSDRYSAAAEELIQAAEKGDLVASRRAWASLNNSCTNCHGAFRPSTDDGF
jgi:cytochrome c556